MLQNSVLVWSSGTHFGFAGSASVVSLVLLLVPGSSPFSRQLFEHVDHSFHLPGMHPGQSFTLHFSCSFSARFSKYPGHCDPPCRPCLQLLTRNLLPSPHFGVHGLKSLHSEKLWSIGQDINLSSLQGQVPCSSLSPSQGFPPFFGGMHSRLLIFIPVSPSSLTQDFEHCVHLPHSDHLPSTRRTSVAMLLELSIPFSQEMLPAMAAVKLLMWTRKSEK